MRIMPIINNGSHNVGRYNPSCKGTQLEFDTRLAELQKQGYVLVNDGTITTDNGKILCDKNGDMLPGYFFTKNDKTGYEVLVTNESLDKIDSIKASLSRHRDKYWCLSKEPNSLLYIEMPDSKILGLRSSEIENLLAQKDKKIAEIKAAIKVAPNTNPALGQAFTQALGDKTTLKNAIERAKVQKSNVLKIMTEAYKLFLWEITMYQDNIRFLNAHADSQGAVEFFRNLGFSGGDYNPKRPMNTLCIKIGNIRPL